MPRSKKPAGTAVDRRNGQQAHAAVLVGAKVTRPPMPTKLRAEAKRQWTAYWDDAVAGIVQSAEVPLVVRWIKNLNRYLILLATADAEPLVSGSTGQLTAHPMYAVAFKLEASLRLDERQLGLGPKNRADLGLAVVTTGRSLAELNERYGGGDDDLDVGDEPDPRLTVVDGEYSAG
jgi:P27 family predicted phage terminase small subunit